MTQVSQEMPRFDFSKMSFQSDEDLAAYEQQSGQRQYVEKYFKQGRHEVLIEKLEVLGKAKNDDTWVNVKVHFKGTGEKRANALVQVPTQDVKYGPKGTLYPYQNYKRFCAAVGHEIKSVKDVPSVTKALFADMAKLENTPIVLEIGYEKAYAKYVGKKDDGSKVFNLVLRDGSSAIDGDGVALEFADKAATALYAKEKNIPFDEYTSVRGYDRSAALSVETTDGIDF